MSFKPLKIVIIGGVAAGLSAAVRARKNNNRAEITVIQKEKDISYGACGLPYFIAGKIPQPEQLIARDISHFTGLNIEVLTEHEALSFRHHQKLLTVRNLSGAQNLTLPYDKLIIATGARAVVPAIPGAHLKQVFTLRSLQDGIKISEFLAGQPCKKIVILGSGYLGLEMVEAFTQKGMHVSLVEQSKQVMPAVDSDISELILKHLHLNRCEVYLKNTITQITGREKVEQVSLQNGGFLEADAVLLATGLAPNTDVATSSGVALGKTGAIAVNTKLETNLHGVYAAGDCAEVKNLVTNRFDYIPLGTTANKQGRVAGDNASGRFSQMKGVVATSALKLFNAHIAKTGLNSNQAQKLGIRFATKIIHAHTRAAYSSCKKEISIKLIFKKPTGLLLGAQIVGGEDVAKRIDLFAVALHQRMTIFDICELDLSYSPPFAPVWDPVLIAALESVKVLQSSKR